MIARCLIRRNVIDYWHVFLFSFRRFQEERNGLRTAAGQSDPNQQPIATGIKRVERVHADGTRRAGHGVRRGKTHTWSSLLRVPSEVQRPKTKRPRHVFTCMEVQRELLFLPVHLTFKHNCLRLLTSFPYHSHWCRKRKYWGAVWGNCMDYKKKKINKKLVPGFTIWNYLRGWFIVLASKFPSSAL